MSLIREMKDAAYHVMFHHKKSDGWVTLAKKEQNGFWKQYHYRPEELAVALSEWIGEDVYFSQNTFYKPFRRIENIRQLRALYVDLDCYLFNYIPDQIILQLEAEYFNSIVPDPNLIIFSGQGLVPVWFIEPVPFQALPLWQAVQKHFVHQLASLGGDSKAVDASRVFRIAGTINSKNGETVEVQYRHEFKYILRELQEEYLPELKPTKQVGRGKTKKVQSLFNIYTLNHARLLDLIKLVELRNYDVEGYRETILFLYRYWSCCFLDDPKDALDQTLELNSEFRDPLPEREVKRATKSAETAYFAKNNEEANRIAISKGYLGAGYNLRNSKIITWLDITEEEQRHLKTIIGRKEKYRRNNIRRKEERREKGVRTMQEYNTDRSKDVQSKLKQLRLTMEQYPDLSNYQMAEKLGVSEGYIRKLKKKL